MSMAAVLVSLLLTLSFPTGLTLTATLQERFRISIARSSNLNFLLKLGALKTSENFKENTSV